MTAADEGDIGDAGAEQARGVEMPGDVLDAGGRDQPVGRLEAGDAAKRRRPDHRARGLRAERDRHHAGGDGGAEPDDEPPGVCAGLCGLRVTAGTRVANSVVTVLPMTMPPARRVSATAVASARGWRPA